MSEIHCMTEAFLFSMLNLRALAKIARTMLFGTSKKLNKSHILKVLEEEIYKYDNMYDYRVVEKDIWPFGDSIQGIYIDYRGLHTILIRSDIYALAKKGNRKALKVICHEIAHWLLQEGALLKELVEMCMQNPDFVPVMHPVMEDVTELFTKHLMDDFDEEYLKNPGVLLNCTGHREQELKLFACYYTRFSRRLKSEVPLELCLASMLSKKVLLQRSITKELHA